MVTNKILAVAGISMPYYPPRPVEGPRITGESDLATFDRSAYVVQGKLNGDRVCVLVLGGQVHAQNRHGAWYSFAIENKANLLLLPNCTLLDGEVWQRKFFPFEAVVEGGRSYMFSGPETRVEAAKRLCDAAGLQYVFDPASASKAPHWEGYVLKKIGSPYLPLGSDSQVTKTWIKRKWTNGSTLTP